MINNFLTPFPVFPAHSNHNLPALLDTAGTSVMLTTGSEVLTLSTDSVFEGELQIVVISFLYSLMCFVAHF